jgi:hypothetical protein
MKFLTSDEDLSFGDEKSRATENKIPARDVNTDILSGEFFGSDRDDATNGSFVTFPLPMTKV